MGRREERALVGLPVADPEQVYVVTVMPKSVGEVAFDTLVRVEDVPPEAAHATQIESGFGDHDPFLVARESYRAQRSIAEALGNLTKLRHGFEPVTA